MRHLVAFALLLALPLPAAGFHGETCDPDAAATPDALAERAWVFMGGTTGDSVAKVALALGPGTYALVVQAVGDASVAVCRIGIDPAAHACEANTPGLGPELCILEGPAEFVVHVRGAPAPGLPPLVPFAGAVVWLA